jgi:hypothetical protein
MRLSNAAFSLARLHATRVTIGERPSFGARRFVGMVSRNRIKTIDPNVVIGIFSITIACFGLYFAMSSDFERKLESKINGVESKINGLESKINGVATMLESKLDGQDRQLAGQDRKVEAFGEKIVL